MSVFSAFTSRLSFLPSKKQASKAAESVVSMTCVIAERYDEYGGSGGGAGGGGGGGRASPVSLPYHGAVGGRATEWGPCAVARASHVSCCTAHLSVARGERAVVSPLRCSVVLS